MDSHLLVAFIKPLGLIFQAALANRSNASQDCSKIGGVGRDRKEQNQTDKDLLNRNLYTGQGEGHLQNAQCGRSDQSSHNRTATTLEVVTSDNCGGEARQQHSGSRCRVSRSALQSVDHTCQRSDKARNQKSSENAALDGNTSVIGCLAVTAHRKELAAGLHSRHKDLQSDKSNNEDEYPRCQGA